MLKLSPKARPDFHRIRDASDCTAWLHAVRDLDQEEQIETIEELLHGLSNSPLAGDTLLEIAERVRRLHLAQIESAINRLHGLSLPMAASELDILARVSRSMIAGRELYKRVFATMASSSLAEMTRPDLGEAPMSLRVVLPLARACNYQMRLLEAHLLARVEIDPAEWEECFSLAQQAMSTGMFVEPVMDLAVNAPPMTCRDMIALPLLLRLIDPPSLAITELRLSARLARRWVARVRLSLDTVDGGSAHRAGPVVTVSPELAFCLDMRRVLSRLDEKIAMLGDEAVASRAAAKEHLSVDVLVHVIMRLRDRWSHNLEEAPGRRSATATAAVVFGFPRMHNTELMVAEAGSRSSVRGVYVSRRDDDNLLVSPVAGAQRAALQATEALMSIAERVSCAGQTSDVSTFQSMSSTHRLQLDQLVAVRPLPDGADMPFALGRIVSIQHLAISALKPSPAFRFGVVLWHGAVTAIGVAPFGRDSFDDAYLLPPDAEANEGPTLVLRRGAFRADAEMTVRDQARDFRVRQDSVVEQGQDFERVRFVLLTLS